MAKTDKQLKGDYYEDFVKPVLNNGQITWKGENYEFIFNKVKEKKQNPRQFWSQTSN